MQSVFVFLFSTPHPAPKKNRLGEGVKTRLSLSWGVEAGFMHNFKVNSHIPVLSPPAPQCEELQDGKLLVSRLADSRVCTHSCQELGGQKVFQVPGIPLYCDPHPLCPNIYIYQFHSKDNLIMHCSRKQLSISLCV